MFFVIPILSKIYNYSPRLLSFISQKKTWGFFYKQNKKELKVFFSFQKQHQHHPLLIILLNITAVC